MLLFACCLPFILCSNLAQAPPAFPNSLLYPDALITANNSLIDLPRTITATPKGLPFRVPGTHTVLDIVIHPNEPINQADMAQTIHRTTEQVQDFITAHDASERPLSWFDDPFVSSEMWRGCYIGVKSKRRKREPGRNEHFTVGILANVLQGLWLVLFEATRFFGATIGIFDDEWAFVGIALVVSDREKLEPIELLGHLGGGNSSDVY